MLPHTVSIHLLREGPMRRIRLSLVALLLAAPLWVVGSASAVVGTGTFQASDQVRYSGCRYFDFVANFEIPSGSFGWSIDVDLLGPDGLSQASDYLYGNTSGLISAPGELLLCTSDKVGRNTIVGEVSYYGDDYIDQKFDLTPKAITLRAPLSTTSLKASSTKKRVMLAVQVRDQRPNGYFRSSYASTVVQMLKSGRWVPVANGQKYTDANGVARFSFAKRKTATSYRAVTKPDVYSGSTSPAVRVK